MSTAHDRASDGAPAAVTVLGLGAMGAAIARTFVERGYRTTVWNRTASRTEPLVEAGAAAAASVAEAVSASPVTVICVLDDSGVDDILRRVGDAAEGRVLVNVTSGSPAQARAHDAWASEHGADYLDGKIMGDPPYVGTPDVMFAFSGAPDAFAAHEQTLQQLGTVTHHGADAGAAAVEFLTQVAASFELLIGYLHALRVLRAEGADIRAFTQRFGSSLASYPSLLDSFAEAVISGEYGPDLGSLDVQAALMDDLITHRESLGVESVRMREVKELMDRRIGQGLGDQGFSSLFELLGGR